VADPNVRASWARGLLGAAAAFGDHGQTLVDAVPEDCRAEVSKALSISWLSFDTYLVLIRALEAQLGPDGVQDLFSQFVFDLRTTTLYKPLLRGIAVFGHGAESMLRLYARGYALSFRHTGRMSVGPRDAGKGVTITLSDIPEQCRVPSYARGHAGSIRGGFRLAGARVRVVPDLSQTEQGLWLFDAEELEAESADDEVGRGVDGESAAESDGSVR
jgi:hypothetical protein